jgi:XTP/dITP diphosphohydrolase
MLDAAGPEGLARTALALGDPRATARCLLLYTDGERRVAGEGVTTGTLVLPPRGEHGFGWDPVFQPDGEERTFGELEGEAKDAVSHRGRAWRALMARW